jgi:hypothetical protein
VEISFDIEAELFIEFSLLWLSLPFVNIHDIPLLVDAIVICMDTNISVFSINIALNFKNLTFLVDNRSTLVLEELPPS